MSKQKISTLLGSIVGIIFFIIAYVYFSHTAGTLPTYFPGYADGGVRVHTKHGMAALVVGIGSFIYAWFQSGTNPTSSKK